MAITYLNPGNSHTYDLSAWDLTAGVITTDSGTVHGQPRSLKIGSTYGNARKLNVLADAGFRISFYFQFSALPSDHTEGDGVFAIWTSTPLPVINMRLDESTGVLKLYDSGGGTAIAGGAGTIGLSPSTWYRIAIAGTLTSNTVNHFKVWVDGVLDIDKSNAGLDRAGAYQVFFSAGTGQNSFFSDIYIDDGAGLDDPGDMRVTAKLPASNSTNSWNTAIGANPANRWENVNERPLSETNGWEETALAAAEESYGIQADSAGDVNLTGTTIVGFGTWVWAKGGAGGLGAPKIIHNGADVAVALTSSAAYYATYTTSATYPSGVIGMKSAGVLDTTFLYETGVVVAYTPATGGPDFTFIKPWMIA